jgi:integrase
MPLQHYKRGATWWAKGRVEINGRAVSEYIRESTGSPTESGAKDWIRERENAEIRRHHVGDEADAAPFTFNDAVNLYAPDPDTAKYLIPIVLRFGELPVTSITALMIKEFAREHYPNNSTDSWRRWVITPARAVIIHAHELGKCPPIRIKGFNAEERNLQDKRRGKKSRPQKTPGDWTWLLRFRQHASQRHAALALFMFTTGARIGQAVAMHPDDNMKWDEGRAIIPGAKGHGDREVTLPPEVLEDLRGLPRMFPRRWDKSNPANLRLFGFADKDSHKNGWRKACEAAGIPWLPAHSAGRHGFGQDMRVRQGVDKKAVEAFGGWSAHGDMVDRTYTHGEDSSGKILAGFRTGLVQAEMNTGIKLLNNVEKSDE